MLKTFSKKTLKAYTKSTGKDGLFNTYFYRILAMGITIICARLNFSPNLITLLSFLFTLAASCFFLFPDRQMLLFGIIFFNIGALFDCADGQLAILMNRRTKLGSFIDPFVDRIGEIVILGSLAYSYFQVTGSALAIYLYIVWHVSRYLSLLIDEFAKELHVSIGIDNLRKTTTLLPFNLRKLIRWDGGFQALLITVLAISNSIPLLILLFIAISLPPHIATFAQILSALRNQRNG